MTEKPTYEELEQRVRNLESELQELKRYLDRSQDAIYCYDIPSRRFVLANKTFCNIYGVDNSETISAQSVLLSIHPEDRDKVRKAARESLLPGCSKGEVEFRLYDIDGSTRWIYDRWIVIRDASDNPLAIEGIGRDETKRKQAEEELRTSQKQLSQVIDFLPDATFMIDEKGKVVIWNKAMESLTGVLAKDILGKGNYEYALPFFGERRPILIDLLLHPNKQIEDKYVSFYREENSVAAESYTPYLRDEDCHLWGTASLLFDEHGKVTGAIESIRDITKGKQAEEKIKHLNRVLSAIRNVNQLIASEKGRDRLIQGACNKLIETRGYNNAWIALFDEIGEFVASAEAGLGNDFLPVTEKLKCGELPFCAKKALSQSEVVFVDDPYTFCTDCPLSDKYSGRAAMSVRLEHGGKIYGLLTISIPSIYGKDEQERDLLREVAGDLGFAFHGIELENDRRQAWEALQESEKRYRQEKDYLDNVFQNSADAIAIVDKQGRFTRWNKQASELFGYSFEEMQGKHFSIFYANQQEMQEMLAILQKNGVIQDYEINFIKKDETIIPCSLSISILYDEENEPMGSISIVRDLTEWKKTQQKLKEMSLYDSLTNLYSRCFFEEEMKRLDNERYCPIGVIVCDVDGLKLINDTLGHVKGDKILKTTADILRQCFRSSDIIARIGGDEFAVLLPQSGEKIVESCCNRIRKEVKYYNEQNLKFNLSISIGYAVKSISTADINEIFRKADNAMYKEKLQQSYSSRSEIVQALIKTMEARDYTSEGHANRLHDYALQLGKSLELSEERLHDLQLLARFHDLGKVGVPDCILFKPDRLTDEEFQEMKQHCEIGYRIALSTSDLAHIADFILKHHEWWNGQGYPLGLAGKEIPLECRILSIVDAYDTMVSKRPYKNAMTHQEAVNELWRCAGTQFDPELVEKFIQILEKSE